MLCAWMCLCVHVHTSASVNAFHLFFQHYCSCCGFGGCTVVPVGIDLWLVLLCAVDVFVVPAVAIRLLL